jgi:uncharacterized protein (DUF3820 family)
MNKKEIKRLEKIKNKNLRNHLKLQKLASSWNPLPKREDLNKIARRRESVEKRSGFINCAQGYFNVGKYKGVAVKDTPVWYLSWVADNIQLNPSELNLLRKVIKYKESKQF